MRLKRFDSCWSLIVFLDLIKHNSCGHSKPLAHLLCSSHRKFYQLFCFKTHGKSVHNFPPCFVFLCIYSCVLVLSLWYFMFSPMENPGLPIWILVFVNVVTVSFPLFIYLFVFYSQLKFDLKDGNWRICEQTRLFNHFMFKNEIRLKIKSDERFLAKWRIHKIAIGNHVWELRLKRTFFNRQRGKAKKKIEIFKTLLKTSSEISQFL